MDNCEIARTYSDNKVASGRTPRGDEETRVVSVESPSSKGNLKNAMHALSTIESILKPYITTPDQKETIADTVQTLRDIATSLLSNGRPECQELESNKKALLNRVGELLNSTSETLDLDANTLAELVNLGAIFESQKDLHSFLLHSKERRFIASGKSGTLSYLMDRNTGVLKDIQFIWDKE